MASIGKWMKVSVREFGDILIESSIVGLGSEYFEEAITGKN